MNERLHEELAYCVPLGIPHSRFLSWSELDQDKVLAYLRAQREVCPDCGTREEEWRRDKYAYVVTVDRCRGCETKEQGRRHLPSNVPLDGVRVGLMPRALVEALEAEQEEAPVA